MVANYMYPLEMAVAVVFLDDEQSASSTLAADFFLPWEIA